MGRKKVEIKKIEKKKSLAVTSKRRTGLFKRVGDLCGVEATVIVFSPAGRPFVYGHPSADSVIDRFLHQEPHSSASMGRGQRQCLGLRKGCKEDGFWRAGGGQGNERGQRQFLGVQERPEVGREREEAAVIGDGEAGFWWDAPIENMGLSEMERFKASIEEFREKVADRVVEMTMTMVSGPSNATVEYATPPGSQPQHQFQCQPHEHDSSPLLDGAPYGFASPMVSNFDFDFDDFDFDF
ncbi:hypothetical protein PVL29_013290 [Vitis rotundifolia]|uniref:MADS-box domain-containing protein n=1 Tax=Vitis rotundifolia TaxID=103349 RepID=A0AA38ZL36_VITRO|nr:hypothetical protein PVL29_013290 [Vitis rotundifolia]